MVYIVVMIGTLRIFSFHDPATTEMYTLSLHDALPIYNALDAFRSDDDGHADIHFLDAVFAVEIGGARQHALLVLQKTLDRKSTRLNSSHTVISYAVFCLKKKTLKKYTKVI